MPNININDIYPDRTQATNTENFLGNIPDKTKTEKETKVSENFTLRNIDMDNPFYGQKDIKSTAQEIESRISQGQSTMERKNSLTLAMAGMTEQDFSKMKEDGFSPEDMDEEGYVTVADKIRIQLAKGGADISMMGDVSEAAIEEIGGSAAGKLAIESAMAKAAEIEDITEDTKRYLIKNDLEPTIENVHKANFSTSVKYAYSPEDAGRKEMSEEDFSNLRPQVENVIKNAGLAINDNTIEGAKWLLSEKLPLTVDTIRAYVDITEGSLKTDRNEILKSIYNAVSEGNMPEDGYILTGASPEDRSREIINNLSEITDIKIENAIKNQDPITIASLAAQEEAPIADRKISPGSQEEYQLVQSRRALEEIRLSMTYEVSVTMIRRGINVDTKSLSDLVDDLKSQENRLYNSLFGDNLPGVNKSLSFADRVSIYEAANSTLSLLKTAPAETLGGFKSASEISLRTLSVRTETISVKYTAATEKYETLMTAPRADMGDSIKKAFQNVDDILSDLGFEATDANERAVRILGYNSLSITRESVLEMRGADEELQRVFKNLTPGVVAKMVKEGENPLDLSLSDLNKKIDELREGTSDDYSSKEYADFLYKMDRQEGFSEEERASFVGIYRLMHQVDKSDGAVIGALLNQGAEITMRNMMTAIRSSKHKNRETVIDDSFGGRESFKRENLTITQQIEMAFQTNRMRDAKEIVSPEKLANIGDENVYMNMTPDELARALEQQPENNDIEKQLTKQLLEQTREAVNSEARVYAELEKFDLPITPINIEAYREFMSDRNGVYRKVFSRTVTEDDLEKTPEELMVDIIHRFGEAVKRPEDMAKAQEKLAETAENVMKKMLVEEEVDHIDVRGMRVALKQVRMLGEIGKRAENYTIPITVADENGTLNLRVVRAEDDNNGLVDIAFNMDSTGPVNATFRFSAQGVTGSLSAVKDAILDMVSGTEEDLVDSLSAAAGVPVTLQYLNNPNLSEEEIYGDKDPGFATTTEQREIPTAKLYGLARTFIDFLGNLDI